MLIFKYLSPGGAAKVLEADTSLSLRFGLPRNYNDPYELFLQPSQPLADEELRAFYDFFLGSVIQAPVSCFSKKPDSVTMWAHYGEEGTGVLLGFDEDSLARDFALAYFDDVTYSDTPAKISASLIEHAFRTGKRRHSLRLLAVAHRAAFFMKRTDWQYEQERRLVVANNEVSETDGLLLAAIQPSALRFIILGARAEPKLRNLCQLRATQHQVPLLEFRIGKRHHEPFFVKKDEQLLRWAIDTFEQHADACVECGEPVEIGAGEKCSWCAISEGARGTAARRSMLVVTLHLGIDKELPLEFEGLLPKGREAESWIADAPQRQASALMRDLTAMQEVATKMGLIPTPALKDKGES